MVLLILHVVINVDLDRLDVHKAVRVRRQRLQCRLIEALEGRLTIAGQLFERLLVQFHQQGGDTLVELGQREEGVAAQARQNPALDDLYAHLGFGFVLGLVGSRRYHSQAVMCGQLLVGGVEVGVIAAGLTDTAAQIIGDNQRWTAAIEGQHAHMATQPVGQRLTESGLGVGVVGGAQHADKDLGVAHLAGAGMDDRHRLPAVVHEAFLAGGVGLAHGALLALTPLAVTVAELGVAVATGGILLGVFLPQQLLGHALALELLMKSGPVGLLVARRDGGIGTGVEQPCQAGVVELLGQGPGEAEFIGPGQQFLHGAEADLGAVSDLAKRQPGGQSQSQNFSDVTHSDPLGWHGPSGKSGEVTKSMENQCVERDSGGT